MPSALPPPTHVSAGEGATGAQHWFPAMSCSLLGNASDVLQILPQVQILKPTPQPNTHHSQPPAVGAQKAAAQPAEPQNPAPEERLPTERRTFSCLDLAMSSSMSSLWDLGLAASGPGCWAGFSRGSAPPPKWASVSSAAEQKRSCDAPVSPGAHTWRSRGTRHWSL